MPRPDRYEVCLARHLGIRTTALRRETVHLAPYIYVFASTHREKVIRRASERFDPNLPFLSEDVRYVRIDGRSATAQRFNPGMRRWGRASVADGYGGEQPGDPFVSADRGGTPSLQQSVVAASSDLATVASNFSTFRGGAHPVEGSSFKHWSFRLGLPFDLRRLRTNAYADLPF